MKHSAIIIITLAAMLLTGCDLSSVSSFTAASDFLNSTPDPTPSKVMVVIDDNTRPYGKTNPKTTLNTASGILPTDTPIPEPETKPDIKETTLLFAGDFNFDDGYSNMNNLRINGGIEGVLSANILSEMRNADFFILNNEFPYSDRGEPTQGKTFTFRAKPDRVSLLNDMGADVAVLANNHAYDFGPEALCDTIDILKNNDILPVGAGKNLDEACTPAYLTANGLKIAIIAATQIERYDNPDTKEATASTPGVLRCLDSTRVLKVLSEARQNADFTICYIHWGSENTYDVDYMQKNLAAQLAENGADLIIGDHSHCLQGFEYVNGVPVVYSLGNFWFSSKDIDTGLVKTTFNADGLSSLRFLPCRQHDCRTDMYETGDPEYTRILGVMQYHSPSVGIDADGFVNPDTESGITPVEPKPARKAVPTVTPEIIPETSELVQ